MLPEDDSREGDTQRTASGRALPVLFFAALFGLTMWPLLTALGAVRAGWAGLLLFYVLSVVYIAVWLVDVRRRGPRWWGVSMGLALAVLVWALSIGWHRIGMLFLE